MPRLTSTKAYAATTYEQLEELRADLPGSAVSPRRGGKQKGEDQGGTAHAPDCAEIVRRMRACRIGSRSIWNAESLGERSKQRGALVVVDIHGDGVAVRRVRARSAIGKVRTNMGTCPTPESANESAPFVTNCARVKLYRNV